MENSMVLLGYCIRMSLISVWGQFLGLCMTATMLKRRRSLKLLGTWLVLKYIILICVIQIYLGHLQGNQWYEVINYLLGVFGMIITMFLFYFTFHGTAIKVFIALSVSEIMISIMLLPSVILVNFIQGRTDLFLFTVPFQMTDLLIPVFYSLFFVIFYHLSKKVLLKYREYRFKHSKIWMTIYIIYAGMTQFVTILDITDKNMFLISMYGMFLLSAVAGTLALVFIYVNYNKGIQLERAYLNTQMGLLETHYQAIQSQVQQMESCQKMVAEQMEEITSRKGVLGENVKEYLENLKQEYGKLRAGMYCDDWSIDAVLYCQIEVACSQGIEVDCQIKGYDRNIIDQQKVAQLLFLLLYNGICILQEENSDKKIQIRTDTIKGRFVISFGISNRRIEKLIGKQIKNLVKETGGMLDQEMKESWSNVIITFL